MSHIKLQYKYTYKNYHIKPIYFPNTFFALLCQYPSLNKLFSKSASVKCAVVPINQKKRIFPLLLTNEYSFSSPFNNFIFNKGFQNLLKNDLREEVTILPLLVMTTQEFEVSLPEIEHFNELLLGRIEYDPKLMRSFSEYLKKLWKERKLHENFILKEEYRSFRREINQYFFGRVGST